MKFLFTIHNFLPEQVFGAEKACIVQMKELLHQGHQVALFYAGNEEVTKEALFANGLINLKTFRVRYFPSRAQIIVSAWKPHIGSQFKKALDIFGPDVVVFHHLVRLSADLPKIAHDKQIQTVYWLHDFYPICPSYSLYKPNNQICTKIGLLQCAGCISENRLGRKGFAIPSMLVTFPFFIARKFLFSGLSEHIDLFVSPSHFLLNTFKKFQFQIHPSVVIPNGTDRVPFSSIKPKKRSGSIRFGFLGNPIAKKGIEVLARAFQKMADYSLIICGFRDLPAMRNFRDKYPNLHAELRIFNGNIDSFFQDVDVVIVPSLWYENQPTVIIEAYENAKPVICSNIGGIPEMVKDGHSGFLFEAGNGEDLISKVNYLRLNPSELECMQKSIPQWPSIQETMNEFVAILRKNLLKRHAN